MDDPHHHHHHPTSHSFLTNGSEVEVSSTEDGSNGAWYAATIIHPTTTNNLVYVEYHHLLSGDDSRLREHADISYVRPAPVPDSKPPNFQLNDVVEAFYRDGWWTGVVTTVVDDSNYVVTFRNPHEEVNFCLSDLRTCKKWVCGRWVQQPLKQVTAGWMFIVGKKVEVSFEKEGLLDVWFPATVLKNSGNVTFFVEYQQPGAGDEGVTHKVTVDYLHIRPSPPRLKDKNFVLLEKVDAYYDFGWWCGVITKELADNRYIVFFKNTKKEGEFIYSSLRPHMEWKGGKWFNTSQRDTTLRTTHSLIDNQIEHATPIIRKQSPVATSVIKIEQQDLDSNDKSSPNDGTMKVDSTTKKEHPSVGQSVNTTMNTTHSLIYNQIEQATPIIGEQSPVEMTKDLDSNDKASQNDENVNDDSITKKHPSVGQSEGFDSEPSGMTDQAFSKKADMTVDTTYTLIDNQIERATPIIGEESFVATSIMKIQREKDFDGNDKTSPNCEIKNDDSIIKKKHPTVGQLEGVDSEVSGMTDQAFSKKGDTTVGTTHSLIDNQIEQATRVIVEQSPVATTIMPRERQKNSDSSDKPSPNDEIVDGDSTVKKKHPSVGQSEGFDSEVSGMADQAFGKKGDTAVRSTRSSIDDPIEQATLISGEQFPVATTIPHTKRQKNLDSNVNSSPNDEIMNDDDLTVKKSKKSDTAVSTTHLLIDKQIEQANPIIDEQSPVATTIMKIIRQKSIDSNDKNLPNDEFMHDDSVVEKKSASVGQSEGVDSEVSVMTDQAFSKTENLSQGKKVHGKRQRSVELKTPAEDSSKKKGKLANELKSLQASTNGSEVNTLRTRTQKIMGKKDATKDFPLVSLGLRCHRMTVSQSQGETGLNPDAKNPDVAKSYTKQPAAPLAPSTVVDQAGSEGHAAPVAVKRKRGRPFKVRALSPKTPATVEHETGSNVPSTRSSVEAGQSKEVGLTASSGGNKSLEENPEQSSKASEGWLESGTLPFIKSTTLWKTLESMEAFQMLPQKPHFRPLLENVREGTQEGLAIGTMVTFSTMFAKTCGLRLNDPRSTIEDCLETLVELENNGFDVEVIRERLTGLLLIKDKHEESEEQSNRVVEKIEENNMQRKQLEIEIEEINEQMRELEKRRKQALLKKEKRILEMGVIEGLEVVIEGIKQEIREVGAEFDRLAAAPLVV